jgi:hypothetical protein
MVYATFPQAIERLEQTLMNTFDSPPVDVPPSPDQALRLSGQPSLWWAYAPRGPPYWDVSAMRQFRRCDTQGMTVEKWTTAIVRAWPNYHQRFRIGVQYEA